MALAVGLDRMVFTLDIEALATLALVELYTALVEHTVVPATKFVVKSPAAVLAAYTAFNLLSARAIAVAVFATLGGKQYHLVLSSFERDLVGGSFSGFYFYFK